MPISSKHASHVFAPYCMSSCSDTVFGCSVRVDPVLYASKSRFFGESGPEGAEFDLTKCRFHQNTLHMCLHLVACLPVPVRYLVVPLGWTPFSPIQAKKVRFLRRTIARRNQNVVYLGFQTFCINWTLPLDRKWKFF